MKIGEIAARKGEKAFGFLDAVETRGRFPVRVPLHIIRGALPGPVLLVQAGVSGLEIEPAMILPKIAEELDASRIAGTLLLVPLLNTSGFEFDQINAIWDDKNLNSLGRGKADGTVSEQMIHTYFREVVAKSDAVLDIHTGALSGYYRYAGVFKVGAINGSQELAVALGLPQVLVGQPEDQSILFEAAKDDKLAVSVWIGGGPGLRDHREADMCRVKNAVLNAMKHLGMLRGEVACETDSVSVIKAHTVLKIIGERGLVFLDKKMRGQRVKSGERLGYVKHPFTGDIVREITAPREGIMLHAGAAWPILPEDATLAILGDLVEEVTLA